MANKKQKIAVTLVRSMNACTAKQISNVKGLGLRKMHHRVVIDDTLCNRGMINKVIHMLSVEEGVS